MQELNLKIDSGTFNLIWRSLHARESELLNIVSKHGDDSDEGADALNDIVTLRLYKEELEEQAGEIFDKNAFILEDVPLEAGTLRSI